MNIVASYADAAAVELLRVAQDAEWKEGSAEPWVRDVLCALLRANASRTVIEIGGFEGYTSRALLAALKSMPGEKSFTVCELDPQRVAGVQAALDADGRCAFARVACADSLAWIPTLASASVDFVWLDGCHEKPHVLQEIRSLWPKLAPGGIIAGHDVFGVCDLREVFDYVADRFGWSSMSLDLPRLGPAGGIGLLQKPR